MTPSEDVRGASTPPKEREQQGWNEGGGVKGRWVAVWALGAIQGRFYVPVADHPQRWWGGEGGWRESVVVISSVTSACYGPAPLALD